MTRPVLAALLLGLATLQAQSPGEPVPVQQPALKGPLPSARVLQLQALVEAAEHALEADDEAAAGHRADEADALTADWPTDWLAQAAVQALLERLKAVQDQLEAAGEPGGEPGLKVPEEVITISGDQLRAELELVGSADHNAQYDFPIDLNDKVLTWVSLFSTTKKGFMENALGRATRYLPMVRQVFAEEGIPSDLAYLAVIESGYRNEAKSRARAVGMWQFIRSTGRIYGLASTSWAEERRDPVKSTRAAARYLRRLYEVTGDWYLAVSSYNAGPLSLDRAIQNLGTRNFWDLARSRWLRTETKNYVPELCAAILVGRNPERYGLSVAPLTPYAYETVTVPSKTALGTLARCAGTDLETLKGLNPELLKGTTPPGAYQLRVPPGKAIETLRQMGRVKVGGAPSRTYTVHKGDTPASVARRFRIEVDELLQANDLSPRQFKPGRRLHIPEALDPVQAAQVAAARPAREVRPLQALPEVRGVLAAPPGAATEALVRTQPTSTQTAAVAPERPSRVKARPGDTLARIARAHGVSLGALIRLNPAAARRLHPGDLVVLPGGEASVQAPTPERPTTHRVGKGETLAGLAERYQVRIEELRRWNALRGDRILVGQRLRLTAP